MANISAGDRVRIVSREPNEEDVKSQMYFGFYGGLTGSVQKVYSKTEVAVEIETESLTREIRKRHDDVRDQMKTKWLDGLSEEGRGKLTEREKDFNLRYVVLVSMDDLQKAGAKPAAPAPKPSAAEKAASQAGTSAAAPGSELPRDDDEAAAEDAEDAAAAAPARKTLAEIEAAEEQELLRRAQGNTKP
jgi:hypothetical protein